MALGIVSSNPAVSQNMFGTYTAPGADLSIYGATNKPAYQNILENPYFLRTLAAAGASLDPQGTAGALGAQAQTNISSQQAAKANTQSISDRNRRHQEVVNALNRFGGISPQGQPGPYKIALGKNGDMTLSINSAEPAIEPPPRAPDRDTTSSNPPATAIPNTSAIPTSSNTTPQNPPARVQATQGYGTDAPSLTGLEAAPPGAVARQNLGPVPASRIGPYGSAGYNRISDILPFYQAPLRSVPNR